MLEANLDAMLPQQIAHYPVPAKGAEASGTRTGPLTEGFALSLCRHFSLAVLIRTSAHSPWLKVDRTRVEMGVQ